MGSYVGWMANRLTKRQAQVLDFIKEYRRLHGKSPNYREIMWHTGQSYMGVYSVVVALENKGLIERRPYQPRGIEVLEQ
jgi:SOS-response transcriptional repressor LexA